MIDESIREALTKKINNSRLNFEGLLNLMENSGIDFKGRSLKGPQGISTFYGIYLNLGMFTHDDDEMIFYIISHEIGHYKRYEKVGKENIIKMLSLKDFDDFCNHVIEEEIIADRYACFVY